jgi:glyoxylase-like metal-dependent hydrolase (beta-lactamase superfamily II)
VTGIFVVEPTEVFRDRLVIADRDAPVELIHPGRANTDGDAIAWLPRQRVVVTGDVVVAPFPFGYNSYPQDWIAALRQVGALDFVTLVPGHGAPQRDRAYLDRLVVLIEEVRRQMAPLAAQGLSLDDARARIDLSAQRQAFVGDDPWMRRWFDYSWTTPFTESAWKEARGEEIVQGEG